MNSEDNLYMILGISPNATQDELKESYRKLILQCHPDKDETHKGSTMNNNGQAEGGGDRFISIQKAFKILNDENARREYDLRLKENELNERTNVNETVLLAEMIQKDSNTFYHICRCGGFYNLTDVEVTKEFCEYFLECDSCSLIIKVIKE